MSIGQNIKRIRTEKGLTQRQLAEKTGLKDSAIRRYESEKVIPKMPNLRKISDALGVSIVEIDTTLVDCSQSTIGTRVRQQRLIHGLTQAELAKISGLSIPTIQAIEYESWIPRRKIIIRIAQAMNVSISTLESDYLETVYVEKPLSDYTMEELLSEIGRRLDNGTRKEL